MHGLYRSLINNMVTGVTAGYTRKLEVIGVGYRAQVNNSVFGLQAGIFTRDLYKMQQAGPRMVRSSFVVFAERIAPSSPALLPRKAGGEGSQSFGNLTPGCEGFAATSG